MHRAPYKQVERARDDAEFRAHRNAAESLEDAALAERLSMLAEDIRAFKPAQRAAFMVEVATRLRRRAGAVK